MLSECYFCRGRVEPSKVDVDFRWGRRLKVIRGVPAGVCRQCGERYFDAAVYKEMEKLGASRKKAAEQMQVEILSYREAS
ncbi:type II toxin-antitoxin system MqsA family antitoxin [Candidatus Binatia bacterium]|nr:type II toxin-antitoxin system MqsA family antitoxin [Candidatus Binatia bacterium]